MDDIKELKDETLKDVAGGFDAYLFRDCDEIIAATKELVSAYETVLVGDNGYENLKKSFEGIVSKYEHGDFREAYNMTIALKEFIGMFRNRGSESFNKFVGELENNILGIDYLLRQFCTNI